MNSKKSFDNIKDIKFSFNNSLTSEDGLMVPKEINGSYDINESGVSFIDNLGSITYNNSDQSLDYVKKWINSSESYFKLTLIADRMNHDENQVIVRFGSTMYSSALMLLISSSSTENYDVIGINDHSYDDPNIYNFPRINYIIGRFTKSKSLLNIMYDYSQSETNLLDYGTDFRSENEFPTDGVGMDGKYYVHPLIIEIKNYYLQEFEMKIIKD